MRDLFQKVTFLLTCSTILLAFPLAHAGGISECGLAPGTLLGQKSNSDDLSVSDTVRHKETQAYPIRKPNGLDLCYQMALTAATEMGFPNFIYGKFIDSDRSGGIEFLVDEKSPKEPAIGDQRYYKPGKNCFTCCAQLWEKTEYSNELPHNNFVVRTEEECGEQADTYLKNYYKEKAKKAAKAREKSGENGEENTDTFAMGANVWVEWEADDGYFWSNSVGKIEMSRFDLDEILAEAISISRDESEED